MLDGRGVQRAAKCLKVWWDNSRWGRWGRWRQSEFHLQPMRGASPVHCCSTVWALRHKMSTMHVQLVEGGLREAMIIMAGHSSPVSPVGALGRGLGLELSGTWGTITSWLRILQIVQGRKREGIAKQLLRTSITTQVRQLRHKLTVYTEAEITEQFKQCLSWNDIFIGGILLMCLIVYVCFKLDPSKNECIKLLYNINYGIGVFLFSYESNWQKQSPLSSQEILK